MNDVRSQSLFFSSLPDLQKLYALKITLSSQLAATEVRTEQWKMCKQLLLLCQGIISSPAPGTLNQISVIMTIPFYKTGTFQVYVDKHGATVGMPERVSPTIFQVCLSYTLRAKLAPNWNQAGHLLIQGRNFLSQMGKQNAVVVDIIVSETQLCISVEICRICLPLPELEDFDISTNIIKNFNNDTTAVISECSILSNWCYVLPSMKMGQIMSISHLIPHDSPFHSYSDLQLHWENLYGYLLPEDSQIYPSSCIRSQPIQYFPRADIEAILDSFITDLKTSIPHICGFPFKMTQKAMCTTNNFIMASVQKVNSKPANLTVGRNCKVPLTQVVPNKDDEHAGGGDKNNIGQQWKISEHSGSTLKSNNSKRIIPIFKGKLLQVDRQFTKRINENKTKHVSKDLPKLVTDHVIAKSAVFSPIADQINKSLPDTSFQNVTNKSVSQKVRKNIRDNKFILKEENKDVGYLLNFPLPNGTVLTKHFNKTKATKLHFSLISADNQSEHQTASICQNKPAHLSAGQNLLRLKKTEEIAEGALRIFQNQIQNPMKETKTNAYRLTSPGFERLTISNKSKRKRDWKESVSSQDITKTSRPHVQEKERSYAKSKKQEPSYFPQNLLKAMNPNTKTEMNYKDTSLPAVMLISCCRNRWEDWIAVLLMRFVKARILQNDWLKKDI
ncbi:putative protein C18orf63 [Ophiophagus hannah]|uniref:DUF4708 domain-containing protein n=1 Tax=Ophiophagus hannah TaxID=8665 RepID=V8PH10_OPHHA|nr:putative protein C18orf63 [Ophiophagus hannah]